MSPARARANTAVPDRLRPAGGRPGYRTTPTQPKPETAEQFGRRLASDQMLWHPETVPAGYYAARRALWSDEAAELPTEHLDVLRAYWLELSEWVDRRGGPIVWSWHYGD